MKCCDEAHYVGKNTPEYCTLTIRCLKLKILNNENNNWQPIKCTNNISYIKHA